MTTFHAGLPVSGYRPQSDDKVKIVNKMKAFEERVLRARDDIARLPAPADAKTSDDVTVDKRWLAIGRTHIEHGFMAINRSIFQPGRVALPEEPQSKES